MGKSMLNDLGQEVTGVVAPVSLCMAITVFLVKALVSTSSSGDGGAVQIASIGYSEKSSDSDTQKLSGALLNAIIFISVIAGLTFLLVILFKFGCTKIIYGYMAIAVFNIFFFLAGKPLSPISSVD